MGKAGTQTSLPLTRFPGLAKQTWSSDKDQFLPPHLRRHFLNH
jgi:hypothetical protein